MYNLLTRLRINSVSFRTQAVALLSLVVLILAACQPIMLEEGMAAASPTEAMAEEESAAASPTAELPESSALMVMVSNNAELGDFLVDGTGMTLYMYLRDEPGVTNCYDQCAQRWPPLMMEGDVELGAGVDEILVGNTERTDGSLQLTYNAWPLYYWVEDVAAGETTGQGRGDVWFVLTPGGDIVGYVPPTLAVSSSDELGDFLVDGRGITLYMYTNDEPGVTNCYDQCAQRWPPLMLEGDAKLGDGIDEAMVGTTERTDGGVQVTYNGWPLYYWVEDLAPGDTTGQGRGDVWYVVSPSGDIVQ